MNIAFLGRQWLPHTFERMNGLKKRGHKVLLFSWPLDNNLKNEDLHLLPFPFSLKVKNIIKYFLRNIFYLRKLIKMNNIEVIHIMGIVNGIYALFLFPTKIVIEHNGSDILLLPQEYWYYKLYYKLIYPFSDGIVQDSNVSKEAGQKIGAPRNNNEIIDIGIDFNHFNPDIKTGVVRKKYGISKSQKIVFHARGSRELYNSDIIIRSIQSIKRIFPDVIYMFAGYYDTKNPFNDMIKNLGIQDNIIFIGNVDRLKKLPYFYTDADLVISIPSSDSSPLSVYEAMACKTPIILSKLPWLEYKFGNVEYLSVNPRDDRELTKNINTALNSPSKCNTDELYDIVATNINVINETKKLEHFYYNL